MTKTTILTLSLFIACLGSAGYAYLLNTSVTNKVNDYIKDVDLSLYAHRGVLQKKSPDTKQLINEGIASIDQQFGKGERLVALANYHDLLKKDPSNMELLLRIGIIYLQEKEYNLAQENLTAVYGFKESVFALDGAWFLALLNAEYENWDRTKKLLNEIVQARGNYHLQAAALLKALS